jgi:Fe-S cluster assembly ATP-binding protein
MQLRIEGLRVSVEGKDVLNGVDLTVPPGEVHALMGPNGSGKSSMANALMGNPAYEVTSGEIHLNGTEVTEMGPDERARAGLFLGFQYPAAIPGLSVGNFLRTILKARRGEDVSVREFRKLLEEKLELLEIDRSFMGRDLNDGFSGGEKKRMEVLQMLLLEPDVAILDEIDSGLDIDALKLVARGIEGLRSPERAQLLITHYQRILDHVRPDKVHVLWKGRVVRSGGPELAEELEERGYDWVGEGLEEA